MVNFPIPTVLRAGDTSKTNPFTVLVVANPALEAPWNSGTFIPDPITGNKPGFDTCTSYIESALFGTLPGQVEAYLGDPAIAPNVRLLSLFQPGLPAQDQFSFAAQDGASNLLIARRTAIRDFLVREGIIADVVYAVSASADHQRASAWFTTDDDTGPGDAFVLNGATFYHRYNYLIPGTVALPVASTSLTALHEFQHAISSYTNGKVVDLYVDSTSGLNIQTGRPIPSAFGTYVASPYSSDPTRGPLGYPAGWTSFHCELYDKANPAIMDNYWLAPGGVPAICQNDKITRAFVVDQIRAKMKR